MRIAVLLPVRNGAKTLAESLDSLRRQRFREFRVIVADDGSTDETAAILRRTAGEWSREPDPRLTVLHSDRSLGIPRALALAASALEGETFLARQDADDVSFPDRFTTQVDWLDRHPEVGVLGTDIRSEREDAPTDGWRRYEAWLNSCHTPREIALNLWIESPLPHPTVMMRREAYERVGGYRDLGWPEDYDLWLRMHRAGIAMAKIPQVLYGWRDHAGRTSRTHASYTADRFLACRAHHLARFLAGRPIVLWGAGRDGRRAGRALAAEGARIEAFLDIDPRKIGRRAYGKPILCAEEWLASGTPGAPIVLAAVGTAGARELIRSRLLAAGLREGPDFLCIC